MKKKLLKIIIIILNILVDITMIAQSCSYTDKFGNLYPSVTEVEVGEEIVFNCTLTEKYVDDGTINLRNVFFTFNEEPIDSKYVNTIDPYTLQLKIDNVTIDNSGYYSCKFNKTKTNETIAICYSDGKVGYKPLNVTDFQCIYYYQEKLSCSWTKPYNPFDTNYSLYHYYEAEINEKKPCGHVINDDEYNRQHCYWNTSHPVSINTDHYFLELEGSNQLGTNKQSFYFDQKSITRLPPPRLKSIKSEQFINNTYLQWTPPKHLILDEKLKNLIVYRIDIINNGQIINTNYYNPYEKHKRDNDHNVRYEIDNLRPYTNYRFNISCRIDHYNNPYWSDTISIDIQTDPDIPVIIPFITDESFEIVENNEQERKVIIYWEPIPDNEKNGPHFEYLIIYNEEKADQISLVNQTTPFTNITLTLRRDKAYLIRIYSKNSIGSSLNYAKFHLPKENNILWHNHQNRDNIANNIEVIMNDDREYELDWSTAINDDSTISIKDYVVFWCLSFNNQCIKPIKSRKTNSKHEKMFVTQLPDHNHEYKIGIAFNDYNGQTSGIIWTKCLANMKTKKINGFYTDITNIGSNYVDINWKLFCKAQRVLINRFEIEYCQQNKCHTDILNNSEINYHRLNALEANTEYRIRLIIKTLAQRSIFNSKTIRTNEINATNVFNRIILYVVCTIVFIILLLIILVATYRMFKTVKQKNDFTINIGMEDQSFKEQFQLKFNLNDNINHNDNDNIHSFYNNNRQEQEFKETNIDNGNIKKENSNNVSSESSLLEETSDLTTTMTNQIKSNNSTNTINNENTGYVGNSIASTSASTATTTTNLLPIINHNHISNNQQAENNKNSKKNPYIKLSTNSNDNNNNNDNNQFCSSDSGVVDDINNYHHHDNLEYFYNQDESSLREPFLPANNKNGTIVSENKNKNNGNNGYNMKKFLPKIMNNNLDTSFSLFNNNHNNNNNNFWSKLKSSTSSSIHSAPNSNLSSPNHHNNNDNNNNIDSSLSSTSIHHQNNDITKTNNINNKQHLQKQAYVMIKPSSNSPKLFLQPSHTTNLPQSFNMNRV